MIKFKLYLNEHLDKQEKKHEVYLKNGFKLTKQRQKEDVIIRKYIKQRSF